LGDSIRAGVENFPVLNHVIARFLELFDDFEKKFPMLADSKPLNVFEDEVVSVQFSNDPYEVLHQRISWVVQCAPPNKGEALTGGAAKDHVNGTFAYPSRSADA
jgi:hypothetical protein